MTEIPEFKILTEVKAYQDDTELATNEWHEKSMSGWHITSKWASIFSRHLETLKPIAENGDPLAQYSIGAIYFSNQLYDNEEEAISKYEDDRIEATKWLELAARQGVLAAIDNLIGVGVGEAADKLRELYKINIKKPDTNLDEWKSNMKLLYELAYGKNS